MEMKLIGVVGAGQMGSGIAEVALSSGFNVLMRNVTQEAVEKGRRRGGLQKGDGCPRYHPTELG
jgi:3-hydroxyacyl-CoA dehydrogenase